MKPSDIAC